MNYNKPYIIGETAFHHEGDEQFLVDLIGEAIKLKLDAVKFHLLVDLDDYMTHDHEALEILRKWCLNEAQWDSILSKAVGIDIILLCNDVKSIKYAISSPLNIAAIEIHASGLNDVKLLEKAAAFKNTVILGTGGSTLDEIDYAVSYLKGRGKNDVLLMHGFQNYPTDFKDIKLERMNKLSDLFNLPVGYADHTDPKDQNNELVSCLGVSNGHTVIEKHFTHKYGEKRIDAQAAITLGQMARVKELANIIHQAVSKKNSLTMSESELKYGDTGPMKKAIVAKENIKKGTVLSMDHISFKRTNSSAILKQNALPSLLGLKTSIDIKKDAQLDFSNIEYSFQNASISQFHNTEK